MAGVACYLRGNDVALVVLFDLHGRSPHCNAASGVSVPALLGNPERRGRYPSQRSRFVLRQKWFLKWPALEQTLLKEQEYPAMR